MSIGESMTDRQASEAVGGHTPRDVPEISNKQMSVYNSISLGLFHGLAVARERGVYVWGNVWHNAMGLGIEKSAAKQPVKIPFFEDKSALQVSCGDSFSAVLVASDSKYLGNVYTFGLGDNGRLGYPMGGEPNNIPNANEVSEEASEAEIDKLRLNKQMTFERVLQKGTKINTSSQSWYSPRPFKVMFKLKVKLVSCGSAHSLAICEDSTLWSWGKGEFGVLGLGSIRDAYEPSKIDLEDVTHISAGDRHSLAISGGHVYSWGFGGNGRLGLYHSKDVYDPTKIVSSAMTGAMYVSAGQSHSGCVTSKGEIFTWGSGYGGRLGHSWSANGELNYPHLIELPGILFQKISCGMAHTVALDDRGQVYFWGSLLSQSNTPIIISLGVPAVSVNSGPSSVGVLTSEGDFATWGIGDYYRLGHPTLDDHKDPTFIPTLKNYIGLFKIRHDAKPHELPHLYIVDAECGEAHACALDNDGSVYCWGKGLGSGSVDNFEPLLLPEKITFKTKIQTISCGKEHCMALSQEGKVYSWGSNKYGQLGLGDLISRVEPSEIKDLDDVLNIKACIDASAAIVFLSEEYRDPRAGSLMIWGNVNNYKLGLGKEISSGFVMSPRPVECGEPVVRVEIGENHSMVISVTGKLYIAGAASMGNTNKTFYTFTHLPVENEKGHSEFIYQAVPGVNHSALITLEGYVYLCGEDQLVCSTEDFKEFTKFTAIPNEQPVKYLYVNGDLTFAITIDGRCWYWGFTGKEVIYSPKELSYTKNMPLEKISGSYNFGLGFTSHQVLYSWGKNDFGQLGRSFDGTFDKMASPVKFPLATTVEHEGKTGEIERLRAEILTTARIDWKSLFELVKSEPFRHSELFLYNFELAVIRSLQRFISVIFNTNCTKLLDLQGKKAREVVSKEGCKKGVIKNIQSICRMLYLQPAYLARLIILNSQMLSLTFLLLDPQDGYSEALFMALFNLVLTTELGQDTGFRGTVSLMRRFSVHNGAKILKNYQTQDLLTVIESFNITAQLRLMIAHVLEVLRLQFASNDIANTIFAQICFSLILISVDNLGGATVAECRKKRIYEKLVEKFAIEEGEGQAPETKVKKFDLAYFSAI